jgi:hypothetical protein
MSAAQALKAARDAGVQLRLDGDDLLLEASAPPPDDLLDLLSRHKPAALRQVLLIEMLHNAQRSGRTMNTH